VSSLLERPGVSCVSTTTIVHAETRPPTPGRLSFVPQILVAHKLEGGCPLSRRAPGEGSVYKRADGRWVAAISTNGGAQRKRSYRYARTKSEAIQLLKTLPTGSGASFKKLAEDWWMAGVSHGWKPATARTYRTIIDRHLIPYFTVHGPSTGRDIEDYQVHCREGGLSTSSIALHRTILSSIFRQAAAEGLVPENPVVQSKPVRKERFLASTWTRTQAGTLLTGIHGHRYETLYTLALLLGLRSGELRALRWKDLDLEAGTALVRDSGQDNPTRTAKSDTSVRMLPLPGRALELLRADSQGKHSEDLVFQSSSGKPLDASTLRRDFRRISQELGLPGIRFHDLRHTCFSLMLESGTPLHVVSNLAGHSSIRITADVYGHISPVTRREAVTSLEQHLAA
jgi:integrase